MSGHIATDGNRSTGGDPAADGDPSTGGDPSTDGAPVPAHHTDDDADGGAVDPPPVRLGRAELRADLPVAARLAGVVAAVGLLVGVVWAFLAPPQHLVMIGSSTAPLAGEAEHAFDAVAVFVLLMGAYGVVAGAVAWRRRDRRGPLMPAGAVLGALAGAWLGARVGTWVAPGGDPVAVLVDRLAAAGVPGPPLPATLVTQPVTLDSWWALLIPGLGAAMAYVLAAIAHGHEDMGRGAAPGGDAHPAGPARDA